MRATILISKSLEINMYVVLLNVNVTSLSSMTSCGYIYIFILKYKFANLKLFMKVFTHWWHKYLYHSYYGTCPEYMIVEIIA